MMVDMFRSIADEVVLRCAVTRKLRHHWNEAHERSTMYKWMQLVVDTSIVHAVLYERYAAEHRPRKKWCAWIVHVLDRVVLRSSSNRTVAR